MNLNFIAYSIISISFIFSCSNLEEKGSNQNTDFSEQKAKELANIIHSSDNNERSIIEEVTINTQSYSDSIWKLVTKNLMVCNAPIVKKFNHKKWLYCKQDSELELYQVEYTQNNISFTEKYLTLNNQLVYAVEWEKRT